MDLIDLIPDHLYDQDLIEGILDYNIVLTQVVGAAYLYNKTLQKNSKKKEAFNRSKKLSDGVTYVPVKLHHSKRVFTPQQELDIVEYTIQAAKMFYGLPVNKVRRMVYQYAIVCKSSTIPDAWEKEESATRDWYYSFMKRHPNFVLKSPKDKSVARNVAFNKVNVVTFFEAYTLAMEKYRFTPDRIFNLDESLLSTVMKPVKVVCASGKSVASQVTCERGESMTFVGIINAVGQTIPPVFIIPRSKWNPAFMRNTISGSKGILQHNGWMNGECFVETLRHLHEISGSSVENKILLIMDNAECHINIHVVEFAIKHGIVIVTLPPHTTDKLQPLDVSVFEPFKTYLCALQNDHSLMHPNEHITVNQLPALASEAWTNAATPSNILNGFSLTGIWPICYYGDRDAFSDPATPRPSSAAATPGPSTSHLHATPTHTTPSDAATPSEKKKEAGERMKSVPLPVKDSKEEELAVLDDSSEFSGEVDDEEELYLLSYPFAEKAPEIDGVVNEASENVVDEEENKKKKRKKEEENDLDFDGFTSINFACEEVIVNEGSESDVEEVTKDLDFDVSTSINFAPEEVSADDETLFKEEIEEMPIKEEITNEISSIDMHDFENVGDKSTCIVGGSGGASLYITQKGSQDVDAPEGLQNVDTPASPTPSDHVADTPESESRSPTPPNHVADTPESESRSPTPPLEPCQKRRRKARLETVESVHTELQAASSSQKNISDDSHLMGLMVENELRSMNSQQRVVAKKLISDVLFYGNLDRLCATSSVMCEQHDSQNQHLSNR